MQPGTYAFEDIFGFDAAPPAHLLLRWLVIYASCSQEKPALQKHTGSKGTQTALTQSKTDLAQAEKEVGPGRSKSRLGDETVGLARLVPLARLAGEFISPTWEGVHAPRGVGHPKVSGSTGDTELERGRGELGSWLYWR